MIESLLGAIAAKSLAKAAGPIANAVSEAAIFGAVALFGSAVMINESNHERKIAMHKKDRGIIESSNDVIIRVDCADFINQPYEEVVQCLTGMGFHNIHIREKALKNTDQTGRVTGILINGEVGFQRFSAYPKDSYVVVEAIVQDSNCILRMPEQKTIRQATAGYPFPVRYCAYCGVKISEGQNFCVHCGESLR